MRAPVVIVEYDPSWPARFRALEERVRSALGLIVVAIEHVGSTSVPGLAAKPIIDLDVVVDPSDVREAIDRLAAVGYVHEGDLGVPGRETFTPPPGEPHHLYLTPAGNRELRRHLLFRGYLRAHPDVAASYADLKRSLAERHRDDRETYTEAKREFIEETLARTTSCGGGSREGGPPPRAKSSKVRTCGRGGDSS